MADLVDIVELIARRGPMNDPVTPANWARKEVERAWPNRSEMEHIALRIRAASA